MSISKQDDQRHIGPGKPIIPSESKSFAMKYAPYTKMKKLNKLTMFILVASLLIGGCTKNDSSSAGSLSQTLSNDATTPDLSLCKIRRIYQEYMPPGNLVTALFSYNQSGNPYSVIYSNGGTGIPNHYFIYDSKNRLIEYQLRWGSEYIDVHHFYRYNDKNQIIIDSAKSSDAEGAYPYETVSAIEYDAMGRVVKETIVNTKNWNLPLAPTRRPTYTYDSRGNLAVAGWKSSSYDYKINPLRQSQVFQFIFRNYSMNNAAPQPKYNSIGLPLSMKPTNDQFFNNEATVKVIYDCQ